jgi:hypothetical protein
MVEKAWGLFRSPARLLLLGALTVMLAGCATPEYRSREDLAERAFLKFKYSGGSILSGVGRIYSVEKRWLCGTSYWKNEKQTIFAESNGLAKISLNRQGVWIPAGSRFEFVMLSAQGMESCLLLGSFLPKAGSTYEIKGVHTHYLTWDRVCTIEVLEVAQPDTPGEQKRAVDDFRLEPCREDN